MKRLLLVAILLPLLACGDWGTGPSNTRCDFPCGLTIPTTTRITGTLYFGRQPIENHNGLGAQVYVSDTPAVSPTLWLSWSPIGQGGSYMFALFSDYFCEYVLPRDLFLMVHYELEPNVWYDSEPQPVEIPEPGDCEGATIIAGDVVFDVP